MTQAYFVRDSTQNTDSDTQKKHTLQYSNMVSLRMWCRAAEILILPKTKKGQMNTKKMTEADAWKAQVIR